MAYTAQQLVGMGYQGYQGWSDTEANADFIATKGQGKGGPSSPGATTATPQNVIGGAQQFQNFATGANQTAINTLQAGTTGQNQLYQSQLDQIAKNSTQAANANLAARGINPQSAGLAQNQVAQSVNAAQLPIEEQQGQYNATVQNAISQLQSPNPYNAVNAALGLYTTPTQQAQIAQSQAQTGLLQAQTPTAGIVPIPGYGAYNTAINPATGQPYGILQGNPSGIPNGYQQGGYTWNGQNWIQQ